MKQRKGIEDGFSLSTFFIYFFVAILFGISGLPSLSYLIYLLGVILAFVLGM